MESASVLESIAEVGIALAGFGGIAAGLGYRTRGTWSPDDQSRLIVLAAAGLAVVYACYLPYVVHHLGSTTPWRTASTLYLPAPISSLLYIAWTSRRGLPVGYSRIAVGLVFIAQITASTLLLIAAFGYAGPHVFGFYLCATLLMLLFAAILFVRLLATSFRTSEPTA